MKTRPKTPHETPTDDGGRLIEDLQRQCESLRTWQSAESSKLKQREQKLAAQTAELDKLRAQFEADQQAHDEARHALQKTRETLTAERQQFTAQQQKLADEVTRVEGQQARVELDRNELKTMRADLDGEWTSLCRIRRANEKLASELDAERDRLNQATGPALKLTKAA